MKVALEKTIALPATPEISWEFLQDVAAVASCMPGAKLTECVDDTHYKGTVTVRLGPATMSFRGSIEVRDVDASARSLRLIGSGTDSTGGSGASLDLVARIDAADGGLSALVGTSEVSMSGKAAAFGGRMMSSVADQVLAQFASNFAAAVAERGSAGSGGARAASPEGSGPAGNEPPRELNALALAWAVIVSWLRGLFGGDRA